MTLRPRLPAPWRPLALCLVLGLGGGCDSVYGGLRANNPDHCLNSPCHTGETCNEDTGHCDPASGSAVTLKFARQTNASGGVLFVPETTNTCQSDCSLSATAGQAVRLAASDSETACFNGWEGSCSGFRECVVRPPATVTAKFRLCTFKPIGNTGQPFKLAPAAWAVPGEDDVWLANDTGLFHVAKMGPPSGTLLLANLVGDSVTGMSGNASKLFVVSNKGNLYGMDYRAAVPKPDDPKSLTSKSGLAIYAEPSDRVVVGGSALERGPTNNLVMVPLPMGFDTVRALFGFGTDVWVGGETRQMGMTGSVQAVLHLRDLSPERPTSADQAGAVRGIWGANPSDLWFVGDNGTLQHWDGSKLATVPVTLGAGEGVFRVRLNAVFGSSADDVWAVGEGGAVLHWNSMTWSVMPKPTGSPTLTAVAVANQGLVWLVGADVVLRLTTQL